MPAEYCAPVWCCSAHTRLIDHAINDALRIVTGCLHPTPMNNLPILTGIQPAELHSRGVTLSLGHRAILEPGHLLYSALTHSLGVAARRLKSRYPFVPAAQQLISFSDNIIHVVQQIINETQSGQTTYNTPHFNSRHRYPPGMTYPRGAWVWVWFNRLRTGVRR